MKDAAGQPAHLLAAARDRRYRLPITPSGRRERMRREQAR